MTLNMPDSITPENLPPGYPAYLGYVDGDWPTAATIRARFPDAEILTLTVRGGDAIADGCDRETGDLTAATAAKWLHLAILAEERPVLYASRDNVGPVLDELGDAHIGRSQIRILSAHYGAGQHICSPQACGATFTADGTQWTDVYIGRGGTQMDMSMLADDFFSPSTTTAAVTADWQETIMQQLPTTEPGASGQTVRTVQALCVARGHTVTVDGSFGTLTTAAVKAVQAGAKISADGVVGAATWPVLLGV